MKKVLAILRTVYRFSLIWLLTYLLADFVHLNAFRQEGVSHLFPAILSLIVAAVMIYSQTRLLVLFDRGIAYPGRKTKKEMLAYFFSRPKAWITLILFALLPLPYTAFETIFGTHGPLLDYLISRSVLPLFFLAYLIGALTGLTYYQLNRAKERRVNDLFYLIHSLKYLPLYAAGGVMLSILSIMLLSVPGFIKLFLRLSPTLTVIFLLAYPILWLVRFLRAGKKRRKFLTKLADACAERGIEIPVVEHSLRSLFSKKHTPVFKLKVNGKVYTCKLIGTMRPFTLYRFYADGVVARVTILSLRLYQRLRYRATLYQSRTEMWETRYDHSFEAEDETRKIFIFNPCSKLVEGEDLGKRYPLDNGLKVGNYTFYTATGFCNAITRATLECKPNE